MNQRKTVKKEVDKGPEELGMLMDCRVDLI